MNGWQKSVMASPMSFVAAGFHGAGGHVNAVSEAFDGILTRWRVSGRILPVLFSTFDTVLMETPVSRARR